MWLFPTDKRGARLTMKLCTINSRAKTWKNHAVYHPCWDTRSVSQRQFLSWKPNILSPSETTRWCPSQQHPRWPLQQFPGTPPLWLLPHIMLSMIPLLSLTLNLRSPNASSPTLQLCRPISISLNLTTFCLSQGSYTSWCFGLEVSFMASISCLYWFHVFFKSCFINHIWEAFYSHLTLYQSPCCRSS